jgi:hypothetical protein
MPTKMANMTNKKVVPLIRLTTEEPNRAGSAAQDNLSHLDDLTLPPGGGSGDLVGRMDHFLWLNLNSLQVKNIVQIKKPTVK